jgi:DNA-binding winged helix-turn-helix (wHTH) protein/tetratricopeptide (TPR) repeat protein
MKRQQREVESERIVSRRFKFAPFRLDPVEQRLWRDEQLVSLRPRAFEVLHWLLERAGQLVTHEELLSRLWGDVHLSEGVLKTQIAEIRMALGDSARHPRFIETVHRRGYRFIGRFEVQAATEPGSSEQAHTPTSAPAAAVREHLVGRSDELGFLTERWRLANAGQRQIALISGDAGVGKTALSQALLRHLQASEPGAWISWGQCIEQYGAGEPYLPMIDLLRKAWGGPERQALAECLAGSAPTWLCLLSAPPEAAGTDEVAAGVPGRMLREIVEALEELASRRGVVLLIEDLHWVDHSTLDLIAYVAQRTSPARLLLLGTYRPLDARSGRLADVLATLSSRGRCSELPLAPLSQGAVLEYLAWRFPRHALPASVAELIHQRTDGNALFMVGIVDHWLERGLLAAHGDGCELAAPIAELAGWVPETFVRIVERELERLSPLERSVLEAASVAGNEFSVAAVAAALSEDTVAVEEVCMRWARRGQFLRSTGVAEWQDGTIAERCRFRHALYQQIAYEQLGAARQAQLHLRIGQRLEQAYGDGAEGISPELASHFERGRDIGRAVHYLCSAGERALHRSAFHEATSHLQQALQLVPKLPDTIDKLGLELDLLVLLTLPLRVTKGNAASELDQAYARAAELCEGRASTQQLFVVLGGRALSLLLRTAYGEAAAVGDRLLQLACEARDAAAISDAQFLVGAAAHRLGRHRVAETNLVQAIAFHDQRGGSSRHVRTVLDDDGVAARGVLAQTLWMLGYADRALAVAEDALTRARLSGNAFATAHSTSFYTLIVFLRGDLEQTERHAAMLAGLCKEHGFEMFAPFAVLLEAGVLLEQGQHALAIERITSGLKAYEATGARAYRLYWYCALARAHGGLGQPEIGLRHLEEAGSGDPEHRERLWDSEIYRLRGELTLHDAGGGPAGTGTREGRARHPAAEAFLRCALQIAREQSAKLLELRAALGLARYLRDVGEASQGRELVAELYGWFKEGLETPDIARARELLAELVEPDGT